MTTLTRRQFVAGCAAALPTVGSFRFAAAEEEKPAAHAMGVVIHSYGIRQHEEKTFGDPLVFLDYCRTLGAAGVQTGIGARDESYIEKVRALLARTGMYLEGIARLPRAASEVETFAAELRTARACGATVVRSVLLEGRRYETFESAEAFRRFADECRDRLDLARPVVEKVGVRLAIENHKDWRADDLVRIIQRANSPQIGVCVDTGNSIALLEEPHEVVEALASLAFTTHFKDMGVAEYPGGFLLSEVPLGKGFLDLGRIIRLLSEKNPAIRLNLEMITRDPLRIPCLEAKYWATFESLPAKHLAATLNLVRQKASREPLPQVADKNPAERLAFEDDNVRRSLAYAKEHLRS
jgi:sugar phosphate isomerase/epimerase